MKVSTKIGLAGVVLGILLLSIGLNGDMPVLIIAGMGMIPLCLPFVLYKAAESKVVLE